jgi:hypothetical protein
VPFGVVIVHPRVLHALLEIVLDKTHFYSMSMNLAATQEKHHAFHHSE